METNDGYLIGSNANLVNSPGSERGAVLTKIDFNGNLVLNKIIEDWGELESIVPTSSGFVGTGFTGSSPIIFKIDESGDEIWSYSLNQNAVLRNPVEVDDGGYIFCGFKFMGSGDEDIFILRTDSFGNQIWAKAYHDKEGETDIGHSYSMIKLNDGNYGAVGLSVKDGNYSEADIAFIKIDTDGNEID